MYSAKANDGSWYSFGKHSPPPEGTLATLEYEMKGEYKNVKSYTIAQAGAPQTAANVGQIAKNAQVSKDDYWTRREERDAETQKRIQLQASRNSAIALVSAMLQNGIVKLPAEAKREAFVQELLARYTQQFQDETNGKNVETNDGKQAEYIKPTDADEGDWA
jgi:hypothetical protein